MIRVLPKSGFRGSSCHIKQKVLFRTWCIAVGIGLGLSAATSGAAQSQTDAKQEQPAALLNWEFAAPEISEDLRGRLLQASALNTTRRQPSPGAQDILAAALADYRSFVQVLYDAGYFGPSVTIRLNGREAATINPLTLPERFSNIDVQIKSGAQFTFGQARLAPLPEAGADQIPEGFRTGAPATTGILRDAAAAGVTVWRKAGHAKAAVSNQRITAQHRAATLNADIQLQPGPLLTFGELRIAGKSDVRPDAIKRIAGLPSGAQFHPADLAASAERLRRSGAFSAVVLREAETIGPSQTLNITADVEDLPKRRLTFGAELNSSDGIELSTSWMHRNLFGGAERLRIEALVGGIGGASDLDGRLSLRLDRPATFGPDDNLFYLAEFERLDEEHYSATQGVLSVGVRRIYSDELIGEASVGFANVLANDAFGRRRFQFALARVRAEHDKRDSVVNATSGHFLALQAQPFIGIDGGASGVQLQADGRIYRRLDTDGRFVFASRLQIGSVVGPSLSELSPTLGFFSGGAGSVRGHEFQSLGVPVGGDTAGGRSFLSLATELRAKVGERISLVGFYDIGLVDSSSLIGSGSASQSGVGLGLRYDLAGIGPLRLDLALPVDGGTEDGLQFYIGIGQAF
ncbi:autotransporter assembly complex protein TamA [Epibacterium ulvae]|uniref:autotransporter assembly complex protein TamA n=1 Tax=Epibacterium ulvae TaxID=1156985 RepID=UPI00248FA678|nr:BamA/TamA family outer membrane protein [Epibacterium ulvae]